MLLSRRLFHGLGSLQTLGHGVLLEGPFALCSRLARTVLGREAFGLTRLTSEHDAAWLQDDADADAGASTFESILEDCSRYKKLSGTAFLHSYVSAPDICSEKHNHIANDC